LRGSRPTAKHRVGRIDRRVPVVLGTVAALVLTTVTAVAGVAGVSIANAPAASAASALVCDQNTIYGIDANGNMDAINATTGAATLVKSMSPAFNGLGITNNGVASYTFVLTNTSEVAIANLVVTDAKAGTVTCPVTTLAARATTTCSAAPYTATAADVSAGWVNNIAAAAATLPGCTGDRASATCPVVTSNQSSTRTTTIVLASTGLDVVLQLELGALAVLFGLGLVLLGRRRVS
jgi:uncharacterized repeat protein (TIGR01451 family)